MSLWNRIFAELLQNNDLEVGDTDVDKRVYSGKYYTSPDGYKCLIFVINEPFNSDIYYKDDSYIKYYGTALKYQPIDFYNAWKNNIKINIKVSNNLNVSNQTVYGENARDICYTAVSGTPPYYNYGVLYRGDNSNDNSIPKYRGYYSIVQDSTGAIKPTQYSGDGNVASFAYYRYGGSISNNIDDENIDVTSPIIKQKLPESDKSTIIDDDGNTSSGGSGDPDTPNPPNPGGTVPDNWPSGTHGSGTVGSDGTWDFDIPFSLPDLNIDWSISGLTEKFPFSIPFDLVSFYTMLNAEPRAPAIDANIPLGDWYTWHFRADFSQYENWAEIIRNVEFIGFVIGLIYITIRLVKG